MCCSALVSQGLPNVSDVVKVDAFLHIYLEFWIAVDGSLIYARDEVGKRHTDPHTQHTHTLKQERAREAEAPPRERERTRGITGTGRLIGPAGEVRSENSQLPKILSWGHL